MDADEIRTLLGDNIFERAKKYRKRIQQSTCTVNADGVRHISAWYRAAAAAITIRRHGCGRTAALSVRPAAARITRTARAPTASISVHCCWTMPKRMPLHRRQSRMRFPVLCAARRALPRNRPGGTAMPPGWKCCLAKSGTAKRRSRITRPAGCWIPTRKQPLKTLVWTRPPSAPALPIWNRS